MTYGVSGMVSLPPADRAAAGGGLMANYLTLKISPLSIMRGTPPLPEPKEMRHG
jgi:hypothetical protein